MEHLLMDSNTSHVLIYHKALSFMCVLDGFKYISCSYLSNGYRSAVSRQKKFKYISCSYLSAQKTMDRIARGYSNTSHVLIYQIGADRKLLYCQIQIHLMFLFIK